MDMVIYSNSIFFVVLFFIALVCFDYKKLWISMQPNMSGVLQKSSKKGRVRDFDHFPGPLTVQPDACLQSMCGPSLDCLWFDYPHILWDSTSWSPNLVKSH